MAIKLISFDLDNTLWHNDAVIVRAENACYDFLVQQAPALAERYTQQELAALRMEMAKQAPQLAPQVSKLRRLAMQKALETVGHDPVAIPALVERGFECFFNERNRVELHAHSIPLLQALQANFQLASLTNGNADLERIGIAGYFAFSLSAEKVGASKPRPNLFRAALHRANAKPEEAIHIGDHPVDDVSGARDIGMHTIWFNPGKQKWNEREHGAPPGATVHCLSEIKDIIHKMNL